MSQGTLDAALEGTGTVSIHDMTELGRRIARLMATSYGAEWRPHYWDDVWEARDGKWPELDAARPQLSALWDSLNPDDHERYDALKDALYAGWRDELVESLFAKRGSHRIVKEVCGTWLLAGKPIGVGDYLTLLLADGTHVSVVLAEPKTGADATYVHFPNGGGGMRVIMLDNGSEFMLGTPQKPKPRPETDYLRLREEDSGRRHYLGSRDVHCGHGLTLVLDDGTQIAGRYECNLGYHSDCTPCLYFTLAGGTEGTQRAIALDDRAKFALEGRAL